MREVFLTKAFTQNSELGNPAGVMLNASGMTEAQMINVAAMLGYSESAFVMPSKKADFFVRFYTPIVEVPLCGHGTIATFHTLIKEGLINFSESNSVEVTQETKAGILRVECRRDGFVIMAQGGSIFNEPHGEKKMIAELLGVSEQDLLDYPLQSVSTGGAPKLMIPVASLAALQGIKPDLEGIKAYCQKTEARGFYPFTSETLNPDYDFHARQFNPLAGINEDPITGVAAGALGCYVKKYGLINKDELVVEQGYVLGRGGEMFVDLKNGVKVGGYGVVFGKRKF
jgi:PhzF family phenazine biosynthesis protein